MSSESGVADRVDRINRKTERIKDLIEEVGGIQDKQRIADQKNREFEDVDEELADTKEQYERLMEWTEYARRMKTGIPQTDVDSGVDELSRDLRQFLSQSFDDFDDASAVKGVTDTFRTHREEFAELTKTVRRNVQEAVESEMNAVDRTLSLLEVPDIGDEDDEQTCENYQYHLTRLKRGELDKTSVERWEEFQTEYESLDISLDAYDLSDDSKELIWDLLDEETTVHLADLDEVALNDLKTFETFSKIISLQFSSQS